MFALQNLRRYKPKIANTTILQYGNMRVVSKPRKPITFKEKVLHGLVMALAPMIYPVYFTLTIKNWRKPE